MYGKMKHRYLTRLQEDGWDRETERCWQRSLLPLIVRCVAATVCSLAHFILQLTPQTAVSGVASLMSAILVI